MIAGSAASADGRNGISGRFCFRIHPSATSVVHLRPILAIVRWSGLPCFVALGFLLCGFAYLKHYPPKAYRRASGLIIVSSGSPCGGSPFKTKSAYTWMDDRTDSQALAEFDGVIFDNEGG